METLSDILDSSTGFETMTFRRAWVNRAFSRDREPAHGCIEEKCNADINTLGSEMSESIGFEWDMSKATQKKVFGI